jgi:hypothetical protein
MINYLIYGLIGALLVVYGIMCWVLWQLHCELRLLNKDMEEIGDKLTVLAYIIARERKLELPAGFEKEAIEAGKRIQARQNLLKEVKECQ